MTRPRASTEAVAANVLRLLDGRPQATLRRRAGWHTQYLSDRMRGRVGWSVADLVVLCDTLEVEARELLDPDLVVADDAIPAHYDADGRWCAGAGQRPNEFGKCPFGCDHADHYANDGHPACAAPLEAEA